MFGLVMIVKNEEKIIEKCLLSVFQYINYWTICDTGSTDKTCQVITDFFKVRNIPGQLLHHEWKGFAHNRTLAFKAAEPKTRYMYVIDADDELTTPLVLPPECSMADSLCIKLLEGEHVTQFRQQIFRCGLGWEYCAVLHEYPFSRPNRSPLTLQTDKIVVRATRGGDRSKDPLKYWKDSEAILNDILRVEQIPKNLLNHWETNLLSRYYYYIAQSYFDFNDWENCIKWCDRRVKETGFLEERYRAYLIKGRCLRYLSKLDTGYNVTDKQIVAALEDAVKDDPNRSEAHFELASHYLEKASEIEELWREEGERYGKRDSGKDGEVAHSGKRVDAASEKEPPESPPNKKQLAKAWEWCHLAIKIKKPTDKLFIVEDYVYGIGRYERAVKIQKMLGKYHESYKYALKMREGCRGERELAQFDRILKDIVYGMSIEFEHIDVAPRESSDIVVNVQSTSKEQTTKCLASFFKCCQDYALVDKWFVSGMKDAIEEFPFVVNGVGTGTRFTINIPDKCLFFHPWKMIEFVDGIKNNVNALEQIKQGETRVELMSKVLDKMRKSSTETKLSNIGYQISSQVGMIIKAKKEIAGLKNGMIDPKILYLNGQFRVDKKEVVEEDCLYKTAHVVYPNGKAIYRLGFPVFLDE